jgi:hypothetical protein
MAGGMHSILILTEHVIKKLSEPKGTPGKRENQEKYSIYLLFPSYNISLRFSLVFGNLLNNRRNSL